MQRGFARVRCCGRCGRQHHVTSRGSACTGRSRRCIDRLLGRRPFLKCCHHAAECRAVSVVSSPSPRGVATTRSVVGKRLSPEGGWGGWGSEVAACTVVGRFRGPTRAGAPTRAARTPALNRRTLGAKSAANAFGLGGLRAPPQRTPSADSEITELLFHGVRFGVRSLLRRSPFLLASESEAFCDGVRLS